ncbi:UNVERIFIED_CONTAM: hypothetical protein FKN15_060056 [Acipenser sinensis]
MPSYQSVTQTAVSNSSGLSKCSSRSLVDSASSLGVLVGPPVLILSLLLVQSIRTNIRNTERACLSAACNYSITVLAVVFKRAVFYVFSSLYLMGFFLASMAVFVPPLVWHDQLFPYGWSLLLCARELCTETSQNPGSVTLMLLLPFFSPYQRQLLAPSPGTPADPFLRAVEKPVTPPGVLRS